MQFISGAVFDKRSNMQRQNTSSEIIEAEVDELFEGKTYFFIGAYQQCLNEINKLRVRTLYQFHFMFEMLFLNRNWADNCFCSYRFD